MTPHGILVFEGKAGRAHLLDPATGVDVWTVSDAPASFGAGPIETGTPGRYLMHAHPGLLLSIDTGARTMTPLVQVSVSCTYSTAVIAGDAVVVTGGQDGVVRGVVGAL